MSTMTAQPMQGPAAWHGRELETSTDWIRTVSAAQMDELEAALHAVESRGLRWPGFGTDDFPLPTVSRLLAEVSRELEHGRGLMLLRGLPVHRYTEKQVRQLYWGLGCHLGTARHQNARGELIGEVRDEVRALGAVQQPWIAQEAGQPATSRYKARTNGPLRFHTDRCDVVGLLCVRAAQRGGVSLVASSVAVHNEILRRRPDLWALLCGDYHRTREGEEAGGERQVYALPVFAAQDGRFTSHYSRTFVEAAQRLPDVPRMTAEQDAALDLLAEVTAELSYQMTLEPGDLQLLNSHVTYHGRTAFEDDPAAGRDRLLLRLWLSPPNSRPLPPGFEVLWGSIAPGTPRGGIGQPR
jgi:hypothetical protein